MICPDCTAAQTQQWHGFRMSCIQCRTRALAMSERFRDAIESDAITPDYLDALRSIDGDDWGSLHRAVKVDHERMRKLKEQ